MEIGEEKAPSTPVIPGSGKIYIILLNVPDPEAHGVTLSPTPCGLSDTGPGSSGSVLSAYCVASWSSSVGYPSVIPSFLPSPLLLLVVFVCSECCCGGGYYLYLPLASVVQGLPSAWRLRRTLSERPLEGPV